MTCTWMCFLGLCLWITSWKRCSISSTAMCTSEASRPAPGCTQHGTTQQDTAVREAGERDHDQTRGLRQNRKKKQMAHIGNRNKTNKMGASRPAPGWLQRQKPNRTENKQTKQKPSHTHTHTKRQTAPKGSKQTNKKVTWKGQKRNKARVHFNVAETKQNKNKTHKQTTYSSNTRTDGLKKLMIRDV